MTIKCGGGGSGGKWGGAEGVSGEEGGKGVGRGWGMHQKGQRECPSNGRNVAICGHDC